MLNYININRNESEQGGFFKMPEIIFKDEKYKPMTIEAKVIYGFFRNRTSLSRKNNWADANGNIYIIYTIAEIMNDLNCWKAKAVRTVKELREAGLIKTVSQGKGRANLIYVMDIATEYKDSQEPTKDSENFRKPLESQVVRESNPSGSDIEPRVVRKSNRSQIDLDKDIYKSKSKSDTAASDSIPKKEKEEKTDTTLTLDVEVGAKDDFSGKEKRPPMGQPQSKASDQQGNPYPVLNYVEKYNTYRRIIQENIGYSEFAEYHPNYNIEDVDELVNCMLDVICTEGHTVRINGEQKNRAMVINQYLKINSEDIEHVIDRYKDQNHKIRSPHAYLKTMLFTVKQENSHFYGNLVNFNAFNKARQKAEAEKAEGLGIQENKIQEMLARGEEINPSLLEEEEFSRRRNEKRAKAV